MKEPIKFKLTGFPDGGTIKESDVVTFAPEIEKEIMRGIKLRRDKRPHILVDAVSKAAKDSRDMSTWPTSPDNSPRGRA